MSEVPVWNCEFKQRPEHPELNALTVGAKFEMQCRGDIPVAWDKGPVEPAFKDKEQKYSLVVLESPRLDPNQVDLVVTGYKAGKFEPEYVRFMQGPHGFEVAKPKWEIQSVIKQNQGEPPQPYPPFGPWSLALPVWIFVIIAIAVALGTFFVFRHLRRRAQRQRMLEELKRHRTALSPIHQFYRDARLIRRKLHQAKTVEELKSISVELDKEFRLYVLRQFEIPTLDWTDGEILGDLRKRHARVYRQAGDPLKKTLRELFRVRERDQLLLHDLEQLHRMSLEAVERLESAREAKA